MKKVITILIAMLLLLSGCNSAHSNQTEIANGETAQLLADQTDTHSESATEFLTEPTKSKKTVETWIGGKESGYLSKLEEYDENGEIIKSTSYTKDGNTASTEEWIRESDSSGKTITKSNFKNGSLVEKLFTKYDTDNNVIENSTFDSEGSIKESEKFEYDTDGKKKSRTLYKNYGYFGETTIEYTYEYNTNGLLAKETSQEKNYNYQREESITNSVEEYEYDSQGNLIKTIKNGRFGDEYKYEYDKNNNILKTWRKITQDGDFNLIAEYEYSMEGILQQKITYNSDGLSVTYTYNEDGTLIDEYGWPSFADETIHKYYNEKGLLIKNTGTTNHTKTTTYEYNEYDDLIKKYWYDDWDGGSSGLTEYVIIYWN